MATTEPCDRVDAIVEQSIEAPGKARADVSAYLAGLVQQSAGEITPEILKEADRLYDVDVPRFRTTMTEALGIPIHQLQKALARKRQITCRDCGKAFSVTERRRIGGYIATKRTLCEKCDRRQGNEAAAAWAEERAREEYEIQRQVEVDREILRQVAMERDPLSAESLYEHVIRLALCWIAVRPLRRLSPHGHYVGPGCMICDQEPANPFIVTGDAEVSISKDSELWDVLRWRVDYGSKSTRSASSRHGQHPWPPLASVYQAIWRVSLYEYWSLIPLIPLQHNPILMLCSNCGSIVANTHREIDLVEVCTQRENDGSVVEALGVQLHITMKNMPRWRG